LIRVAVILDVTWSIVFSILWFIFHAVSVSNWF